MSEFALLLEALELAPSVVVGQRSDAEEIERPAEVLDLPRVGPAVHPLAVQLDEVASGLLDEIAVLVGQPAPDDGEHRRVGRVLSLADVVAADDARPEIDLGLAHPDEQEEGGRRTRSEEAS